MFFLINGTNINKLIKQLNAEWNHCVYSSNPTNYHPNTKKNLYMVFHRARLKTMDNSSIDIIMDNQILTSQFN